MKASTLKTATRQFCKFLFKICFQLSGNLLLFLPDHIPTLSHKMTTLSLVIFDPVNSKSDQHLISPDNNTGKSFDP